MKKHSILLCLLALLCLTACVRDEIQPCPPLTVKIGIADKNYKNIEEIQALTGGLVKPLDEDMPFKSYIQKLFYILCDAETGEVVFSRSLHDVEEESKLATGYLPEDLPFGKYALIVWGNILSEEPIWKDNDYTTYSMHIDGKEGYDVYMTCDTLLYDAEHYNYTVMLNRVKGKLLIVAENIPPQVSWSRKWVNNLSSQLNSDHEYSGRTCMLNEYEWGTEPTISTQTYLSPTTNENNARSTVHVEFFDEPERVEPTLTPNDVSVQIKRNEITAIRYVYDETADDFDIYVCVNDNWELVHGLEID